MPLTYKAPTRGSTIASIPDFFRFLFLSDSLRGILLSSLTWFYFKFVRMRKTDDSNAIGMILNETLTTRLRRTERLEGVDEEREACMQSPDELSH